MNTIEDVSFNVDTKKPIYPYADIIQNLEIYWQLTTDATYKEWFIYSNEDLYDSIIMQSKLVDDIDYKIKQWFKNNDDITQYKMAHNKYIVEREHLNKTLIEKERNRKCKRPYPLSRL